MRTRDAGFVLLSFALANLSLSAADALTRPDVSGHTLPEGEGRFIVISSEPPQTNGAAWQPAMLDRLDESIARMKAGEPERQAENPQFKENLSKGLASTPSFSPTQYGKAAHIARLLQERGLPASLTTVVAVESAFNPLALSPKGARGLWQLMPSTARRYGLNVEPHADERIDPAKSTRAAASYLKDLYSQFQDWPLALAAYNAGEERVAKALSQTGARDFWTLRRRGALPEETLQYVPAVLQKLEAPLHAPEAESFDSPGTSASSELPAGRLAYATTTSD